MRHAAIEGDIMLIGRQPGVAERMILLAGATVSVDGVNVSIANEGMPTIVQTLETVARAEQWASNVKLAADLWEDCQTLAEAALKQRSFHHSVGGSDTGGTWSDIRDDDIPEAKGHEIGFAADDHPDAQLENMRLKEQIEVLLARVDVATIRAKEGQAVQPAVKARATDVLWVEAISNITSAPPAKMPSPSEKDGDIGSSQWRFLTRWMPSLFRGLPVPLA
jgi:hypothetical protein